LLTDSHAHLDMEAFDPDRDAVLARAVEGAVSRIVTVGIDVESSTAAIELARKYDFVHAAAGLHPHGADQFDQTDLEEIARLASEPGIVAWGEIGLDYFKNYSSREAQVKVFTRQLEMAHELGLPVIIHDREAHQDVLTALQRMGKGEMKGVIHCYSGDMELAEAFMELGYYISIPGTVTYKKASLVRSVAREMPLHSMLIETDCPFLAPVPRRGKRNEPLFVAYTAQKIARLRGISADEVAETTSDNAGRLFRIP
jgi:TatD DNase family protein